jgi:hypothetical protein
MINENFKAIKFYCYTQKEANLIIDLFKYVQIPCRCSVKIVNDNFVFKFGVNLKKINNDQRNMLEKIITENDCYEIMVKA